MATPAFRRVLAALSPRWATLFARGSKMQTVWRLEWTWNADGTVTLDSGQSDVMASVTTPVVASGNGLDVAIGARLTVSFPPCQRVWAHQPMFEPPVGSDMKLAIVRSVNPTTGTLTVDVGTVDSSHGQLSNPAENSRCRLNLVLENLL